MKLHAKKMLVIVLAIATVFSATVPALADTTSDNMPVNSSASVLGTDSTQAVSSITIPLTFDGSNPDSSDVVVEKAQNTSTNNMKLFSRTFNSDTPPPVPSTPGGPTGSGTGPINDGLPKKVITTVSTTDSAIKIVTADRYFLYTPQEGADAGIQQCPFAVEFEGLTTGEYFVTLESDSTTQSETEYRKIYKIGNTYCYSDNIKSIIYDITTSAAINLSVWQEDDNDTKTKLFGPTTVSVKFVENNVVTVPSYYKYISSDSNSFGMELDIPEKKFGDLWPIVSLVDRSGKVVARDLGNSYFRYEDETTDYRYKDVFSIEDILPTNYSYISTILYRTVDDIKPDMYGLKISINGKDTIYLNMVKVVDSPLIKQIYNTSPGFATPVYGGNEAYAFVTMEGAGKDDFEVSILDENGNVIGSDIESKYIIGTTDTVAYKLLLNNNLKFEKGKIYFIKLNIKEGGMYYAGSSTGIHLTSNFEVYDYSFYDDNTVADFTFKAINIPSDTTQIQLGLFKSYSNVPISTVEVTPADIMSHVQFKDAAGKVISLIGGNSYSIKAKDTDGNWQEVGRNFYVKIDRSTIKSPIVIIGKSYFYTNSIFYNFNIALRKDLNKTSENSKYVVKLKKANGDIVGNVIGDIKVEDTTISYPGASGEKNVPVVALSGKLELPAYGMQEGTYYFDVEIDDIDSVQTSINVLAPYKEYAYFCYSDLISSGSGYKINGSVYMLKKDQSYDASEFKYEMTDMFGKSISVKTVATYQESYSSDEEDYFDIVATIPDDTPSSYYTLKLRYGYNLIYDILTLNTISSDSIIIPARSCFNGYYGDNSGACTAIDVLGKMTINDKITAVIYNSSDKEDFIPVKTLSLSKDENYTGKYLFPNSKSDLSGIDGNKAYDIIFLLNNKYLGTVQSVKIAGADTTVFVKGITLNTSSANLTVGNTQTLVAEVTPKNATNAGNITWTTSNANVATVTNGVVTAISAGIATITAKVDDKSATCNVVVSAASGTVVAKGITLNKTSTAITVGNTETLFAEVTPKNATNASNITWTTSNASVATVTNGVVTAIGAGTATITAKVDTKSATCNVVVSAASGTGDTGGTGGTGGGGGGIGGGAGGTVVSAPAVTPKPATTGTTTSNPEINTDTSGKATVKAEQLEKAESLTIKGETNLTFNKAAIEALKGLKGDLAVTIKKANVEIPADMKAIIGDRPVYDFTVTAGGKTISNFNGGSVKVDVPYTLKDNEDANAIVIYYIDAEGKLTIVNNGLYDPATKMVTFKTTHFSKYAVGYNKIQFTDVSGWATNAITYLSSRGIISGVGIDKYAPANKITRADFAVILAKIAGADLTKYNTSRFEDINVSDIYAKAVEWVADNGITNGVGNGKYSPNASISRQEMAVMITKLAKVMNYTLPTINAQTDFADQSAISSYALDAAKAVQVAGIINGKAKGDNKGNFFAPKDNVTKAEVAQMIYVFIKGMVR